MKRWISSALSRPVFCLALVLIGYGLLLLPTVARQGLSWDEQTDLEIARSYRARPVGWLRGSGADPSQTRLPMAAVAAAYALLGTDDLLAARLLSCLVGALTIVGVYVACRRDFGAHRRDFGDGSGLLAGAILATSPFFLSFARTAFTETDIYVACAFVWLLVTVSHLRETPNLGWATVTALILGLALSAKFTVVAIFPAVAYAVLTMPGDRQAEALSLHDLHNGAALLVAMAAAMGLGWVTLNDLPLADRPEPLLRLLFYLALLAWAAVLIWAARHRRRAAPPALLLGFVLALALGTFMILPPVHLTNPVILTNLAGRFRHEMGWNPAFAGEAAALHLASVVFKSSPLIGVGLLLGPILAALEWRAKEAVRFPLLLVGCYFLGLILLPLAQTFYMIPLLPLLAILASDRLLALASHRRAVAGVVGIAAALVLGVDLARCYPDFNLNGYQWLGARYIAGRSTIGYRSVVQTTSDGVQQAAEWLNAHARPGDRVVVYAYPWHIVEATSPNPDFRLVRGEWLSVRTIPDYVVVHINHTIRQRWAAWYTGTEVNAPAQSVFWEPYDAAWLHTHFTKVMAVRRAFGIEMVSIWERNARLDPISP
ncbi:MAG: ArnT family glycosyltransferase [Anaerolineae bacterium]